MSVPIRSFASQFVASPRYSFPSPRSVAHLSATPLPSSSIQFQIGSTHCFSVAIRFITPPINSTPRPAFPLLFSSIPFQSLLRLSAADQYLTVPLRCFAILHFSFARRSRSMLRRCLSIAGRYASPRYHALPLQLPSGLGFSVAMPCISLPYCSIASQVFSLLFHRSSVQIGTRPCCAIAHRITSVPCIAVPCIANATSFISIPLPVSTFLCCSVAFLRRSILRLSAADQYVTVPFLCSSIRITATPLLFRSCHIYSVALLVNANRLPALPLLLRTVRLDSIAALYRATQFHRNAAARLSLTWLLGSLRLYSVAKPPCFSINLSTISIGRYG